MSTVELDRARRRVVEAARVWARNPTITTPAGGTDLEAAVRDLERVESPLTPAETITGRSDRVAAALEWIAEAQRAIDWKTADNALAQAAQVLKGEL